MRIANPKAAREDRVLYEGLFALTATLAEAPIRNAIAEVTSEEATKELAKQLEELRAFLVEQLARPPDGLTAHLADFAPKLRESLATEPDSEALYRDLALEFAKVLWGSLLRQMRLGTAAKDGCVERSDLLPKAGGADERWQEVYLAVEQYGLGQEQVAAVLKDVFSQLARDEPGDRIKLPLALSIDKAMLLRALHGQPEPSELLRLVKAVVDSGVDLATPLK
jgi:hypothetical protein